MKREAGFTLVELLLVVAIMAILGGALVTGLARGRRKVMELEEQRQAKVELLEKCAAGDDAACREVEK